MAFPSNPSNGDTYTAGDVTYIYSSSKGAWNVETFDTVDAASALTKIKTVDGASSGLDADLLEGYQRDSYKAPLNYCSSERWTIASSMSSQPDADTGGDFSVNGGSSENRTEWAIGPNGQRALVWAARNNDSSSNADGGWNKTISGLDPNKSYLSFVYVKRVGSVTNGTFYHGCGGGDTMNLSGTNNTNPYFKNIGIGSLPQDVWCVSIGVIQSNSDTNTTNATIGGIYRLDTGAKITSSTTYKMRTGRTYQVHRTYLYYSTSSSAVLQWYNPGFYEINGHEPTLGELVFATESSAATNGPRAISVYTSSGTWSKPSWCNRVRVQVVGGGGGAAGYSESGGGGGYAEEVIDNPASSVSVTIGGGGGSVQYYGLGGDGGTSSFGSYCSASGGRGANRNHAHSGGRGGVGSGGNVNFNGGGGTGHTNSNASGSPAKGGSTYFGGGAGDRRDASNAKNGNGSPGTGGPGSRGDTGWRGAPGESGAVVVYQYE